MPLSAGTKLGPYEVLSSIGAGGMGEVWKAHDSRLNRDVAIKVSAVQFSERFEREAKAIAALNHPYICQIYDVGPTYLVMEYIEGSPLKGPLPVDKALRYAVQICDALDAAHQKGITHRDLKPDNILVTKAGIKLLDFGLAKSASSGLSPAPDAATLTMALTGKNEIVGTLHYMSPEQLQSQANGQEIDARSDIFSFGLVLYEILTGKRAFEGTSPASVIAAIMERPAPSIAEIASPALDCALKRCLEKDPENRWQSVRDIKAAFELIALLPGERPTLQEPGPKKWIWGVAAVLALAVGAVAVMQYARPKPEPRPVVRFQIPVQPVTGLRPIAALAPDGLSLAYFDTLADGRTALKIRAMDSGMVTDFPATEMAQPTHVFWSPDSETIFYGNRRFLKQFEVSRGAVKQICECPSDSGTVNQDGVILLGGSPINPAIRRISPGGEAAMLHQGANAEAFPSSPAFLPDGRRFLYAEDGGLFLSSLDKPQVNTRLSNGQARFAMVRDSSGSFFLLQTRPDGGIDVIPFDVEKGEIAGPLITLPVGSSFAQANASASQTGILVRLIQVENRQLATWFDRQGKRLGDAGTVDGYAGMDLSPDGGRLALITPIDFRVRDLERGTTTRLAQQVRPEGSAIWSPDGMSFVFTAQDKNGVQHLYRTDASNTRPESLLLDEPGLHWPNDWSRDGKYLLYGFDEGRTFRDLWVLPIDQPGAKPFQYTHGASLIKQGQFSPDGKFVAYTSDESGRYEIYVQPFPDATKGKWVISQVGGVEPQWSRDGRELFFFSGQKMMVVDVRANGASFTASTPKELFSAPVPVGYSNDSHRWQLSPDGKRLLVLVPFSGAAASAYLDVVVNWETLLKQ